MGNARNLIIKLVLGLVLLIVGVVVVNSLLKMVPSPSPDQQPGLLNDITSKAKAVSGDTTQWSANKLQEALAEFNSYLPVIHEAGFQVTELRVEAGIIPSVTATFTQIKVITPEEQTKILKSQESKKILTYVLKSLFRVYAMQLGRFKLEGVEMYISIAPSTTLLLSPKTDEAKPGADAEPAKTKSTDVKSDK